MSSNYTGDPAGADSPDVAPSEENFPVIENPSDGDVLNAASVLQRGKSLANHIAWMKSPIATASQWARRLFKPRNARGQERFVLDHWGMPTGHLGGWHERWRPGTPFNQSGVVSAQIGRWQAASNAAGCAISQQPPGVSAGFNNSNMNPALLMTIDGGAAGNRSELRIADDSADSTFTAESCISLTMDFTPTIVAGVDWVLGFTTIGETVNGINHGVFFIRPDTVGSNWLCRTINGGSPTEVDSGVSGTASASHRFRVELVGANVDDASTSRALFYIDDVLKANITATLPINVTPNKMIPIFGGFATDNVGPDKKVILGPVTYSQTTKV